VFDKEVPIEIRIADSEEQASQMGSLEGLRTKLFVQGEPQHPDNVRVEITSEADLFFQYSFE
jgi:hypothetical protein